MQAVRLIFLESKYLLHEYIISTRFIVLIWSNFLFNSMLTNYGEKLPVYYRMSRLRTRISYLQEW